MVRKTGKKSPRYTTAKKGLRKTRSGGSKRRRVTKKKVSRKSAKKGDRTYSGWVTHVRAKGERNDDDKLKTNKIWKDQYITKYGKKEFKCACIVGEPYFKNRKKMKPLKDCSGDNIVGAHVTLKKSCGTGLHYIVPMCNIHNDSRGGQIQGGKGKQYSVKVSKCFAMRAIRS